MDKFSEESNERPFLVYTRDEISALLKEAEITGRQYLNARLNFAGFVKKAKSVSRGCGGRRSATSQRFWASVLFTRITVTAQSILKLCPETSRSDHNIKHWDFTSIASLVRNLIETYFVFFYLSAEKGVPQDEWEARNILMYVQDNRARFRACYNGQNFDDSPFKQHYDDLADRLNKNAFFVGLPDKKKKELLTGEKRLYSQDEILQRVGLDYQQFRPNYVFLSEHTHSGPLSFYRMADHGRGTGLENPIDKANVTRLLRDMAAPFLNRATNDMVGIFPEWETPHPVDSPSNIPSRKFRRAEEARRRKQ